jgi:hypothetical protein
LGALNLTNVGGTLFFSARRQPRRRAVEGGAVKVTWVVPKAVGDDDSDIGAFELQWP